MKVYRGKAVIVDYSEDDMLLSFWDSDEARQVSLIIPRELIGAAKHVSSHRATTVFIDQDFGLVGMSSSDDDEELVDE